jgi:hypothetical protein
MPRVYTATPADVKYASHTVVKAFIRDPFNAYFYNLMADQANPPWGTEEMMAIHIQNKLFTDLVLVVDDDNRKCAGVALWTPPRREPLGWMEWGLKLLHSAYGDLMGYLYYRNRGVNRRVSPTCTRGLMIEISGVSESTGPGYGQGSWKGVREEYILLAYFSDAS